MSLINELVDAVGEGVEPQDVCLQHPSALILCGDRETGAVVATSSRGGARSPGAGEFGQVGGQRVASLDLTARAMASRQSWPVKVLVIEPISMVVGVPLAGGGRSDAGAAGAAGGDDGDGMPRAWQKANDLLGQVLSPVMEEVSAFATWWSSGEHRQRQADRCDRAGPAGNWSCTTRRHGPDLL